MPFPLRRCPWALITETPEVFTFVEWWEDWEVFGLLPGGSASIADEEFVVYEVLRECARIKADVQSTEHAKARRETEAIRRKLQNAGR